MLTAKGLDIADAKFNFSGMYPKASSFGGMSPDDAQKVSIVANDVKNPALTKVDDVSNISKAGFKYEHNPLDNPKVLADAVEDTSAVYGYRPNKTGSIKAFENRDWTNEALVKSYRENRIKYHQENDVNIKIVNTMRAEGKMDSEIARTLVERRNNNRLASYFDENGNITDIDLYTQALEHCKTYDDLKIGTATKPGKTDFESIETPKNFV